MSLPTDIRPVASNFFSARTHPHALKFGGETVTYVTCARCRITVRDAQVARRMAGGDTLRCPVWPSALSYEDRHEALNRSAKPAEAWAQFEAWSSAGSGQRFY